MTSSAQLTEAVENIYASLHDNNRDLDARIAALKSCMTAAGQKEVTIDPARLFQNNRQGRKLMQSYFKKRGVAIAFVNQE